MADPALSAPRECVECGSPFEAVRRCGRPRQRCLTCSPERLGPPQQCSSCGSPCSSGSSTCRACDLQRRRAARPVCTCKGCGNRFMPKGADRTTYCSRRCAFAHKRNPPKPALSGNRSWPHRKVWFRSCEVCAKRFVARTAGQARCSEACARRGRARAAEPNTFAVRTCKGCGHEYQPTYGRRHAAYCSNKCSHAANARINRQARRARERTARVHRVDPFRVFERDGWRCRECNEATPILLRGTYDPRAPELDHIIPLSKGGAHSYRNTQCLCRECNGRKGAGPSGTLKATSRTPL